MNCEETKPVAEPILQMQRDLEDDRRLQPSWAKRPESIWESVAELTREHGAYSLAKAMRMDPPGVNERVRGVSSPWQKFPISGLPSQAASSSGSCPAKYLSGPRNSRSPKSDHPCETYFLDKGPPVLLEPSRALLELRRAILHSPQKRRVPHRGAPLAPHAD